jgi:hypothetical protein
MPGIEPQPAALHYTELSWLTNERIILNNKLERMSKKVVFA